MEGNSNNSCSEETDRVILEAPVFLSKQLSHKLNVFQHPVRPLDAPLDCPVIRSRIKPHQHEVELEVTLDTKSPNYNQKKGEYIASKVVDTQDDFDKNGPRLYASGMLDKQVLRSGPSNPKTPTNYAVGKFQNGELHICPIEAIVQLQPSFAHGDVVSNVDEEKTGDDKDIALKQLLCHEKISEDQRDNAPMQKVSVKFIRQESEHTKRMRKMTYSYYMKKRAEEKWINTQYFPSGTQEAEMERQKLICGNPQLDINNLNLGTEQYLKALVPYTPAETISIASTSGMVSVASLKPKPWLEKLEILLLSAKIIQFGKLVKLLCDEWNPKDTDGLLHALQTHAIMVRGNWVVKSEVLYPENSESCYNGIPASIMCRARDYLLLLFQQFKYVGQVKFATYVKIPREEVKEMLTEIASYHEDKGWDLLCPHDHDFIEKYPEVTVRQQILWEEKQISLELAFKEMREPGKSSEVCKRQRKKSGRESSVSGNESSSESVPQRRRKKSSASAEQLVFK